jgi:hypothetical protein
VDRLARKRLRRGKTGQEESEHHGSGGKGPSLRATPLDRAGSADDASPDQDG